MVLHSRASCALLAVLITSCGGGGGPNGPTVMMDFTRVGFYDAPFPSVDLQDERGYFDLDALPNRTVSPLLASVISLIEDADGAGLSSPIHMRTTSPISSSSLPTLEGSIEDHASVFLVDVTPGSPTHLVRTPVYVAYVPDAELYGATQILSIVPLQGAPLRPHTMYAAVVTTRVRDEGDHALVPSSSMRALARGGRPTGMSDDDAAAYHAALATLELDGVPSAEVAGLAVFTTADPSAQIEAVRAHALANVPAPRTTFAHIETFDTYCVFEATIDMPVYQSGTPPFLTEGGRWAFDEAGVPIVQRQEEARIFVTLPRTAVPENGFPTAVFVRTGGGGDRPLMDRGPRASNGGPTITPGTGPAMHFAEAGFAGVSIDGPHGGPRNVSGGDEQILVFNVTNPIALRDNIRQSALELMLLPHVLDDVTIDATTCPGLTGGANAVGFDLTHLTLMGHSMGATIGPIVAAHEPMYRALVLSGGGGSYIENILYKQKPFPVRAFFASIVGYATGNVTRHDTALGLFQWANDSADPLSFLPALRHGTDDSGPVHVLMMQGIVDHYIMPTIANAMSLGLGLSLAGTPLDATVPEIAAFTPLEALLPLVGASTIPLPAMGNHVGPLGEPITAIVTQHAEDGIEDGHEVVFQTDAPKHEYACFLYTYRVTGVPRVPAPGIDAPCP